MTDDAHPIDGEPELPPSAFTEIAAAALQVARAQQEADAARVAVEVADERLAAAMADLEGVWAKAGLPGPLAAVPDAPAAPVPVKRTPRQHREHVAAGDNRPLTGRQREVLDAVIAAGGKRADVARRLGCTVQAVDATLDHIGRKGLLPADLVPLLAPRFAKYAPTVAA